jgi:origin recognition complex subunit 5
MLSELASLLSLCPPPLIYLHDPHEHFNYHTAYSSIRSAQKTFLAIDCTECISQRVLFSRILNGLSGWRAEWTENCESWGGPVLGNWDASFDAFAHALHVLWREMQKRVDRAEKTSEGSQLPGGSSSVVLVLEKCERLKDFVPSLFVPLTRLAELVGGVS